MIHYRFCWFNRGLKLFKEEVDACCAKCCHEIVDHKEHRGLLGIRWLCVIVTAPCNAEEKMRRQKLGGDVNVDVANLEAKLRGT